VALADRPEAHAHEPATGGDCFSLVPLPEILGEIHGCGQGTRKVKKTYDCVTAALGPELSVLQEVPVEDIARAESSLLAEAITRLRQSRVIREAGYDGEYGVIRLFKPGELKRPAPEKALLPA